jgi:hypothetical protein
MQTDRSVRSLCLLGTASTSRVLNLVAIGKAHGGKAEYSDHPLFQSPVLNRSIVLKHRVRSDETYLFPGAKAVATKVIVPFEVADLRMGGRSFMVDQRGFRDAVAAIGNYGETSADRDLEVLRLINAIPSLDPFLLREHLRAQKVEVGECYFDISPADRLKMYEFTADAIQRLIALAAGADGSGHEESTAKLVSALLSNEVNERLEPLRLTLMMEGKDFHEGIFSWRGFLYYKWSMSNFWPEVASVLKELRSVSLTGKSANEYASWTTSSKKRIIEAVRDAGIEVGNTLKIYDNAYASLVERQEPKAFRDFLLGAPHMFLKLGDKLGAMSHLTSFWRYRFPPQRSLRVDAEELVAIFQDFENSFGLQPLPLQNVAYV